MSAVGKKKRVLRFQRVNVDQSPESQEESRVFLSIPRASQLRRRHERLLMSHSGKQTETFVPVPNTTCFMCTQLKDYPEPAVNLRVPLKTVKESRTLLLGASTADRRASGAEAPPAGRVKIRGFLKP